MLALPLFSLLIAGFGWFTAISVAAGAIAATIFGVDLVIPKTSSRSQDGGGLGPSFEPLGAVAGDRLFWMLAFLTCVCGVTSSGLVGNHLISICRAAGLPATAGVEAVALTGIIAAFGGLAFGVAADRFTGIRLLAAYYIARALLLFWLPQSSLSFETLSQFAVLFGLDVCDVSAPLIFLLQRSGGALAAGPMSTLGNPGRAHCDALIRCA
ncbi:hypothetical protein [Mesorhizobium japonicum]|nr:hypothetical protein [Mesorhizobium japonicum]